MAHENGSLATALALAERHKFAVFPCHYVKADGTCSCGDTECEHVGKHPWTQNGFKDASTDPETIKRLFRGPRSLANIAIATGPVSGIFVLDEDGPAGAAVVAELEKRHGLLPQTTTALTGRKDGKHRYFAYPQGAEVKSRNKIEIVGVGKVDVDQKGAGGYVLAPGSNHHTGRRYRWEHDPDTTPIAEAPPWLLAIVAGSNGKTSTKPTAVSTSRSISTSTSMIETLATAAGAGEGQRHAKALELVGREIGFGTSKPEVLRLALAWGARCTPAMPEAEVERIVEDLTARHVAKPQADISRITGSKPERSFFGQVEEAKKQVTSKAPPQPWVPFPIKAIPEPIREYVTAAAETTGTDPAFTGTAILPCLAAAVGTSTVIRLRDRWFEPSVLWCGIVGTSGCGKSPALDEATLHVRRRQAQAFEAYQQARTVYDQEIEFYRLALDDWKKGGRKKGDPQPEAPIEPVCERCACSDVTVEALGPILAENERGVLAIRDELSGWFNSHGEYKQGHGSDTEKWLSIHGSRELLSDRKTGDRRTVFVRRAAVSIVGGVQPGTAAVEPRGISTEATRRADVGRSRCVRDPRSAQGI